MSEDAVACRLCAASSRFLFIQAVLGRHEVRYYKCPRCDLIQTEQPYWLDEAYSHAIGALDTGALLRNDQSRTLVVLVAGFMGLAPDAPCLDYGAGHGVLVRKLRDVGLNFYWHDTHAENLFSRGFERADGEAYELVTAFEVFEHFVDVRSEIEEIFSLRPRILLVQTELHESCSKDWWYLAPEGGQHIGFYSRRTMKYVAEKFGYSLECRGNCSIFIDPARKVARWRMRALRAVLRRPYVRALSQRMLVRRMRSRTLADHEALRESMKAAK